MEYIVILHSVSCFLEAEALLFREDRMTYDYPRKCVSQSQSSVVFRALDEQARFPMVARNKENALFGFPPPAVSPTDTDPAPALITDDSSLFKLESEQSQINGTSLKAEHLSPLEEGKTASG